MTYFKAFLAGFFSTLILHQGLLALFHAAGATTWTAYSMSPTRPFGIPEVFSAAFWGGVWGILLWLAIRPFDRSAAYWLLAIILGALAPTLVAVLVVFPLKGQPIGGGWRSEVVISGLLLNSIWGLGVALAMRLWRPSV
jgi:hypothetical protein